MVGVLSHRRKRREGTSHNRVHGDVHPKRVFLL